MSLLQEHPMPEYKNINGGRALRRHRLDCPSCKSHRILFRSRSRDYKCRECKFTWKEKELPKDYSALPDVNAKTLKRVERLRWILLQAEHSMRELTDILGISRKTIWVWMLRLRDGGELQSRDKIVKGHRVVYYKVIKNPHAHAQSLNTTRAKV
jgi:transposase-like protein